MRAKKYVLSEQDMPRQWYNIMADMPSSMEPMLHPGTGQPCTPEDLVPIFPMDLIEQEVSTQRWINIPDQVLDKYAIRRPSPIFRGKLSDHELPQELINHALKDIESLPKPKRYSKGKIHD